ncbi:MAG: type II secretion system protein GspG [Candidatus Brocadiales bacterium]|nr:type II secretion system protein GspG [Candidatus Bathyanammoxibius amoris]
MTPDDTDRNYCKMPKGYCPRVPEVTKDLVKNMRFFAWLRMTHGGAKRGFSLVEIIVVIAIVGVFAGALVPLSLMLMGQKREQTTRQEVKAIYKAIFGDPERGTFGYVGDVGALPGSLDDLIAKPLGVSAFAFYTNNVGYGWRGPYLDKQFSDLEDGWGTAYDFGVVKTGQIRSAGPDRDFSTTDDNIVFPFVASASGAVEVNGTLQVTVYINEVPNPAGTTVDVYYPTNGTENVTPLSDNTPSNGFEFSTNHGIHAVKVTNTTSATTVTKLVNVQVIARRQVAEEIFMTSSATVLP